MNDAYKLAAQQHGNVINAEMVRQLQISNYLKMAEMSENKHDKRIYFEKAREMMRE